MVLTNQPHGGTLVHRLGSLAEVGKDWPRLDISTLVASDLENIGLGILSPLTGFMGRAETYSVLERGRLSSGLAWTVPILLDVPLEAVGRYHVGDDVALVLDGEVVGSLLVEEVFHLDWTRLSRSLFGTDSPGHPGVSMVHHQSGQYLAGPVRAVHIRDVPLRMTPETARALFVERGWTRIAAFQTRNVPHIGHEFAQRMALNLVDGLFINPVLGKKKPGDFRDEVIVDSYQTLIRHYYPPDMVGLGTIWYEMRYAGPKEAIHHAIMRKNLGCTHFIVGRDHAGVGDYYDPYAAHRIFDQYPDLGIEPIRFGAFVYCRRCGSVVGDRTCPHESDKVRFSGTLMRHSLRNEPERLAHLLRPEVLKQLREHEDLYHEETEELDKPSGQDA
jgi:sulfate adenylyltransferase